MFATKAEKKTSKEADEAFKNAVSELLDYERECGPEKPARVAERITIAEQKDKSSLKVLTSLREKFRVREELTSLLHHTLMLIFSFRKRNRRRKSSFFSIRPFRIKEPLQPLLL
jgi:hypothetical protein